MFPAISISLLYQIQMKSGKPARMVTVQTCCQNGKKEFNAKAQRRKDAKGLEKNLRSVVRKNG